jgi:hypothetical protein
LRLTWRTLRAGRPSRLWRERAGAAAPARCRAGPCHGLDPLTTAGGLARRRPARSEALPSAAALVSNLARARRRAPRVCRRPLRRPAQVHGDRRRAPGPQGVQGAPRPLGRGWAAAVRCGFLAPFLPTAYLSAMPPCAARRKAGHASRPKSGLRFALGPPKSPRLLSLTWGDSPSQSMPFSAPSRVSDMRCRQSRRPPNPSSTQQPRQRARSEGKSQSAECV